jgi:hypothetical protein
MSWAIRDSSWRRHLIGLVIVLALAPILQNIVLGSWVFYKERVAAGQELSRLSELPQIGMLPPHAEKFAEARHAGEKCFIRLCTGNNVSIEQGYLFSGTKEDITHFYDKLFRANGWGWSKGPEGAAYSRGQSRKDCVLVVLKFEQETLYRLTYTPICGWERPSGG